MRRWIHILGDLFPNLDQSIRELSLWLQIHNIPKVFNGIQIWETQGLVNGISAFIIQELLPLGHMRQALLSPLQQHKVSQCWLTCGGLCDYHWATAEQAMLEKVKQSITFTMASPDFRCCYMCSVWNSSHLWKQHRPSSYGASTGPTKGQWALKPHFASDCLVGKMHMSSPLEVIS